MRAIFLVLALSLFAICECRTPVNSIMADAHECCVSSCSAQQKSLLRAQMDEYARQNGPNAEQTREYLELALSGAACSGRNAKRTDAASVTSVSTPIDVAAGSVQISVVASFSISAGIMMSYVYAYNNYYGSYRSIYPDNGSYYYYDASATNTTMSKVYTFTVPQYAVNGTWYIIAYAYGLSYTPYISSTGNFTVKATKNDIAPPVLKALSPAILNFYDDVKTLYFTATDDLSGVYYCSFSISDPISGSSVAYGTYYAPYNNGAYQGQISVSSSVTLYVYSSATPGAYSLSVNCQDVSGMSVYYSSAQLSAMGLPSTITLAANDCPAGTSRAYNTTGTCTQCSAGMYAPAGSIKCKTCPPGTSSSVAGASSCKQCPAGTSGIGASWACSGCGAGYYTSNPGNAVCTPCYPGYYQSNSSSTQCAMCPQGTYSTGGAAQCTPCPAGTTSYGYAAYCQRCAPGTYAPNTGSTTCMQCTPGTYSGLGASSCSSCPAPRVMGPASSNSMLNCY